MEKKDSVLVLYSSFDKIYSSKFCGCKAVDYYLQLPGKVCVAVKSADLESVLVGCDQIFRRLLQQGKARLSSAVNESSDTALVEPQRLELCFLVSSESPSADSTADSDGDGNSDGDGSAALRQRIAARLDRILAETEGSSVSADCIPT